MEQAILSIIGAGLKALAPSVAKAITGGQTPEDALKSAQDTIDAIKEPGGKDGDWAKDLDGRIENLPEDTKG
ncbi:hypothetical protein LCGC14_0414530 [marine sediment metagenome]|uniref:Uncharacterized protein n=1 Tax=marine sediment metagenome TaxID=412755 RepID=A0A0F9W1W0_9ZZZZ